MGTVLIVVGFLAVIAGTGRIAILGIAEAGARWERRRVARIAQDPNICPMCGRRYR
jgi:hypothetical protein